MPPAEPLSEAAQSRSVIVLDEVQALPLIGSPPVLPPFAS